MKNLTTIEGVVSELDRTTHVSGGGNNSSTTTTFITIFKVGFEPVMLRTKAPAMINDGDIVKVAGTPSPGQFTAIACKNSTTGWLSPSGKNPDIVYTMLIIMGIVGLCTVIMPIVAMMMTRKLRENDALCEKAMEMVQS